MTSARRSRIFVAQFMRQTLSVGLVVLSCISAFAQKNEVGLLLGITLSNTQTTQPLSASLDIKHGLTYQATYAGRLLDAQLAAFELEVPFVATPSIDVRGPIPIAPSNYAYLFTPGLRVRALPHAATSPFASIGGGYGRFRESDTAISGSPNVGQKGTNRGAWQFGGGVDVKFDSIIVPLSLRGEIRDFYSEHPNFNVGLEDEKQHNVVVSSPCGASAVWVTWGSNSPTNSVITSPPSDVAKKTVAPAASPLPAQGDD
jgi:hypothetical protein